jgi:predicted Zn-ribbon and HTH transcriptional regulator
VSKPDPALTASFDPETLKAEWKAQGLSDAEVDALGDFKRHKADLEASDRYDAEMIARLAASQRSATLELFRAACPSCGDNETRDSPLRCESCEVTAQELSTSKWKAYQLCKNWATCIHRLHPADPQWSRCQDCGREFPAGSASYDDLCDSCTNYGSF